MDDRMNFERHSLWDEAFMETSATAAQTAESVHGRTHARGEATSDMELSPTQLIAQILDVNPSATRTYLSQFTARELKNYLDHLDAMQRPRGPQSRWIRRGDSRAIVAREAAL
jgi:hypothetical protein